MEDVCEGLLRLLFVWIEFAVCLLPDNEQSTGIDWPDLTDKARKFPMRCFWWKI